MLSSFVMSILSCFRSAASTTAPAVPFSLPASFVRSVYPPRRERSLWQPSLPLEREAGGQGSDDNPQSRTATPSPRAAWTLRRRAYRVGELRGTNGRLSPEKCSE